jgi:plastocyanin
MKKLYTLILSTFAFASANAAIINVTVASNNFTPATFTANVGDQVIWTLASGVHNVTSASVPGGASSFSSGTLSTVGQTFSYTITVAGNYGYQCTFHTGMVGGFNVTATSIAEPATDLITNAYPNPFKDKLTIKYGKGIEKIEVFNVVGEKVKSIEVNSPDFKVEIDFEALPSGIYFYRTYNEGTIIETRKVVKAK